MHRMIVFMLAAAALAAMARAEPVRTSISIDASKAAGTMKPLWRDFAEGSESSDPDYLVSTFDWIRPLRPRLVRTDTTLHFANVKLDDSGRLDIDFSGLDSWIEYIQSVGAEPLLCIAYTPPALRSDDSGISPPRDLKVWEELVYRLVRHVNIEDGCGVTYWEVWNEPNHPGFWTGTMQQYLDLYGATVRGALRADPTIKIGGGAFAGSAKDWITGLMDYAKSNNLRLDFVSWHDYNVPPEHHKRTARRVAGWLHDRGMNAELLITEWNYHAGLDPGNDNEIGASYTARCLHQMLDSPLDYAPFFEIKDGWKAYERYYGRWGLITYDNHPKAVYYVFKAFSQMGTDRLMVLGGTPNVNGVASKIGGRTCIILYNREANNTAVVDLAIDGLPMGALSWQRYLIDPTHSNPVSQGHDSELEKVTDVVTMAPGGAIRTSVEMAPYSVTLISIQPSADSSRAEPLPGLSTQKRMQFRTLAHRFAKPPGIDADLSDWKYRPQIAGHDDRSARIHIGWDDLAFYIAVQVREAEFIRPQVDSQVWMADSVQVGFDPLGDARLIDDYNSDDYEYGFGLTRRGPVVWRWECPWWKGAGPVGNAKLAIKRDEALKLTTYEAAIPWTELDPFKPATGAVLRTGITVNDYTTGQERFNIDWGGGIAGYKQPGVFKPVMLVE